MSNKIRSMAKARERLQAKAGMLNVSLAQLLSSSQSLSVLLGQELPIRQSFLLGKIVKGVNAEIEQYQTTRKSLCEKYSEKDADGKARMVDAAGNLVAEGQPGQYDIPKDKMPEFEKEHQELIETEVSIPGVKIKIGDLPGVKIAPIYLMNLDWLIEE